jgi:Holliday junction resolvase-like predicted endonuclease
VNGKSTRSKGKAGELAAKHLLKDMDWKILADTTSGLSTGDLIAESPSGKIYDVEVKNRREIHVAKFVGQSRKNASRLKKDWMVMAKIDGTSSWLVLRKGEKPAVWHQKRETI